jgi:hypothetical protein
MTRLFLRNQKSVIIMILNRYSEKGEIVLSKVINNYGKEIDFEFAKAMMDPFLREAVYSELAPCSDQLFFEEYCRVHAKVHGDRDFQPAQK